MTVVDSSAVLDYLLRAGSAAQVAELIAAERELAAPDMMVFEALAALRRMRLRGLIESSSASAALADLGEFPVRLFPSLPLRHRAWELHANVSAGDALFVALAERLGEPLVTGDRRLVAAIDSNPGIAVDVLALAPAEGDREADR